MTEVQIDFVSSILMEVPDEFLKDNRIELNNYINKKLESWNNEYPNELKQKVIEELAVDMIINPDTYVSYYEY